MLGSSTSDAWWDATERDGTRLRVSRPLEAGKLQPRKEVVH